MNTYMIISKWQYTPTDHTSVKQGPNKSLWDYISRFNNALRGGFTRGDFYFQLTRNPPKTFKGNALIGNQYSWAEQLNKTRMLICPHAVGVDRSSLSVKAKREVTYGQLPKKKRFENYQPKAESCLKWYNKYKSYTPMTMFQGEMFPLTERQLLATRRLT